MDIVHSIVAAGVAQTPLQAQQEARRRAARSQQAYRQTREVQETAAIHLRAVDENDEGASAGVHVSITGDMPEHHPQTEKQSAPHAPDTPSHEDAPVDAAAAATDAASAHDHAAGANDVQGPPLPPDYRHVDVQA